ncbi:MAG: penicillin acylase [Bacteroidetes bacterium]|nr:penicillin acylase [Bacteroidota bacterium]
MKKMLLFGALLIAGICRVTACSIVYYIDTLTGKIYVANNEDYYYDVKPYLQIEPATRGSYARLWYGWKDFAQGGINDQGLFFDGAQTPDEPGIKGYHKPKGNLGDLILSKCSTVEQAVAYLDTARVALTNGHLMFGDKRGHAVLVEWTGGKRNIIAMKGNSLLATNFLVSDTIRGGYPCPRYNAMEAEISRLRQRRDSIGLKQVGNIAAKAVQVPARDEKGREAGTLYSTFIDITDMTFILVYKLNNSHMTSLDLRQEFMAGKARKIMMQ